VQYYDKLKYNTTNQKKVIRAIICIFIFASGNFMSLHAGISSRTDSFKEYLSNAPHVQEIKFSILNSSDMQPPTYYTGATDGTNFFIREHLPKENVDALLSPTNPMGFPFFVGKVDGRPWEISGLSVYRSSPTNTLGPLMEGAMSKLSFALAFGIAHAAPGSFHFNGTNFSALRADKLIKPITNGKDVNFDFENTTGSLLTSNGSPFRVDNEGMSIYYTFGDESLPEGVPSTITICPRNHLPSDYSQIISILKYIPGPELANNFFNPERFIEQQYLSVYEITNNSGNALTSTNNSLNVAKAQTELIQERRVGKRNFLVCCMLIFTVVTCGLIFKFRKRLV
jgi:hypothetical protein